LELFELSSLQCVMNVSCDERVSSGKRDLISANSPSVEDQFSETYVGRACNAAGN
jgi:hypothetical protein